MINKNLNKIAVIGISIFIFLVLPVVSKAASGILSTPKILDNAGTCHANTGDVNVKVTEDRSWYISMPWIGGNAQWDDFIAFSMNVNGGSALVYKEAGNFNCTTEGSVSSGWLGQNFLFPYDFGDTDTFAFHIVAYQTRAADSAGNSYWGEVEYGYIRNNCLADQFTLNNNCVDDSGSIGVSPNGSGQSNPSMTCTAPCNPEVHWRTISGLDGRVSRILNTVPAIIDTADNGDKVDSSNLSSGVYTYLLEIKDGYGNWYSHGTATVTVTDLANTPTASLTVNGQKTLNAKVGDTITYAWSSTNGSAYNSQWHCSNPDSNGDASSIMGNSSSGSGQQTLTGNANEVSCSPWTMTYIVNGSGGTASDSITLNVSDVNTLTPTASLFVSSSRVNLNPVSTSDSSIKISNLNSTNGGTFKIDPGGCSLASSNFPLGSLQITCPTTLAGGASGPFTVKISSVPPSGTAYQAKIKIIATGLPVNGVTTVVSNSTQYVDIYYSSDLSCVPSPTVDTASPYQSHVSVVGGQVGYSYNWFSSNKCSIVNREVNDGSGGSSHWIDIDCGTNQGSHQIDVTEVSTGRIASCSLCASPTGICLPKVDGVCAVPPHSNEYNSVSDMPIPQTLCVSGTASPSQLKDPGPWQWSCLGSGGGNDVSCYATVVNNTSSNTSFLTAARGVTETTTNYDCDTDGNCGYVTVTGWNAKESFKKSIVWNAPLNEVGLQWAFPYSALFSGANMIEFDCDSDGTIDKTIFPLNQYASTFQTGSLCNYPKAGTYTAYARAVFHDVITGANTLQWCQSSNCESTATVTVLDNPITPTVTLNKLRVLYGQPNNTGYDTLEWTASDATSCSASASPTNNNWNGAKSVLGGRQFIGSTIPQTTVFTITCTGSSGLTSSASLELRVTTDIFSGPPQVSQYCSVDGPLGTITWDYYQFYATYIYNETAYQVQVSDDSSFSNIVIDTGKVLSTTAKSYSISSGVLQVGKNYYARVKSWDNFGTESTWSSITNFATPPNCSVNGQCNTPPNGGSYPTAAQVPTPLCVPFVGGTPSPATLSGPGPWNWTCVAGTGGKDAPCSANQGIDGNLGTAAGKTYPSTATSFGTDTFCKVGTPQLVSP